MKKGLKFVIGLTLIIFFTGCSSAPIITMTDVATPVSEQSRIWLSGARLTIISIDGVIAITNSSYITGGFSNGFLYFPSGRHTVTVTVEYTLSDYSRFNADPNTTTVITLSGNSIKFEDDFLPQHTYMFNYKEYEKNYFLVMEDISKKQTWESPSIALSAPKSGRVTNWNWPAADTVPLINPFIGVGLYAGYSNIERYAISGVGMKNFGDYDISGKVVAQGGVGLNWKNLGISIIPELGGGFGSFYIVQYHYGLFADVYLYGINASFGFGSFQGAHGGWEDILNVPTPFIRGKLTYNFGKRLSPLEIGAHFDYYYENNSIGFGLLVNTKWYPTIIRHSLN